MKRCLVPILSLFVTLMLAVMAEAEDELFIIADEYRATIEPRLAARRLLALPALEFTLAANPECAGAPESMTLSIADVYQTFDAGQLRDQSPIVTTLTISSQQLALVAPADFCLADDPDGRTELFVPDVTTVHGSLRCVDEENRPTMTYTSAPLPLRLLCNVTDQANEFPDQDSSTPR